MRSAVRRRIATAAFCFGLPAVVAGAAPFAGVSLKVGHESAPPGGFAQAKVFITEPKPISTGSTTLSLSAFDELVGIAIMSPAQDTYGVALVRGSNVAVSLVSTTNSYGTSIDYPMLTVVGHLPATVPLGSKLPLPIDPAAIRLLNPSGAPYPIDAKPGSVTATDGVSISDVSPGSATLAAGDVVTISGMNFTSGTSIRFAEAKLSSVRCVDSTRIDVTLAQAASMHGMQIKAVNPDGSRATYFSYQRTRPAAASVDPILQYAVPLFPPQQVAAATVSLPRFSPTITPGVAVQNIGRDDAATVFELLDANGTVVASRSILVPASRFVVRGVTELFGFAAAQPDRLRVRSAVAVQVIGVVADQLTGEVRPVVPR